LKEAYGRRTFKALKDDIYKYIKLKERDTDNKLAK
jgi:hypothetical protein